MRRENGIIKNSLVILLVLVVVTPSFAYATLSCSVTTYAGCAKTVVLRLSSATNSHAELAGQNTATYASNVICCQGSQTIGTSTSGITATAFKLQKVTNSHVQQSDQTGYTNIAAMSVAVGTISVGYVSGSCTGYDTTLASISAATNATVGSSTEYNTRVCGSEASSAAAQYFGFTISTNQVYFGSINAVATRYASSTNTSGDSAEVEAHNFQVNTNASTGYTVTVKGQTMNLGVTPYSATNTIAALVANTAPSIGSEQFGLRIQPSGGTGSVSIPYAAAGFAYGADANTPSTVATEAVGDSATTTYSVRFMTNIAANTEGGNYFSNIVYVATANF